MKTTPTLSISTALLLAAAAAQAGDPVRGEVHRFKSPDGVAETCIAVTHAPGGVYSAADRKAEDAFCAVDLYDRNVALCPKLRSTSPGTFVYRITRGPFAGDQTGFEAQVCPRGDVVVSEADGPPASFKVTMNAQSTSATFAPAALLYYHFARYLDASVHVPVSVYRSVDRKAHERRITRRGLDLSAGKPSLRMNHAAWQALDAAEKSPEHYSEPDELFTADRSRIYGVLLNVAGKRYGPEVNGTRESGWGVGQNRDFQETAPFLALRSDKPLATAIAEGLAKAAHDAELKKAMKGGVPDAQMAYWMQDLTEITLLDLIFNQQDRVGNIDYVTEWHWVEQGKVRRAAGDGAAPAAGAVHIRRTWLNHNDAGGKPKYANFARQTGMLEKIRHYNPETYRRLMALDRDFAAQGPLYTWLRDSFGLTPAQLGLAVKNTRDAAAILRTNCSSGALHFDLDPDAFLASGHVESRRVNCAGH